MLIGSKYLSLFPEPVFSTPEGLTLYKSKFLPNVEGELSCIGGPSKALSHLVTTGGVTNVINMFTRMLEKTNLLPRELKGFPGNSGNKLLTNCQTRHRPEETTYDIDTVID